jgi:hypothetical protein
MPKSKKTLLSLGVAPCRLGTTPSPGSAVYYEGEAVGTVAAVRGKEATLTVDTDLIDQIKKRKAKT